MGRPKIRLSLWLLGLVTLGAAAQAPSLGLDLQLDNVVVKNFQCRTHQLKLAGPQGGSQPLGLCFVNGLGTGLVDALRPQDGHADLRSILAELKASGQPATLIGKPLTLSPRVFDARSLPAGPVVEITEIEN